MIGFGIFGIGIAIPKTNFWEKNYLFGTLPQEKVEFLQLIK